MRTVKLLTALIVISLITSCATSYQPKGFSGGYSETWLSEREAQIEFKGNGHTSTERASQYAGFRASELALINGYTHFIIVDDETLIKNVYTQVSPDKTEVRPNGYGGVTARTRRGQTATIEKPTSKIQVYFIHEDELEVAESNGLRPISAIFYLEKNAPEDVRKKILEKVDSKN